MGLSTVCGNVCVCVCLSVCLLPTFPMVLEEIYKKEILLQAHYRVNRMKVKVPWEYLST